MIEIQNLSKKYGDKQVLKHFSCKLPDQGFVILTGKSGAGKTTLLRILMGLEQADAGQILWNGQPLYGFRISAVFQEDRLLERFSALENAAISYSQRSTNSKNLKKAIKILEELGLGAEIGASVRYLSGGMKRRVAIARSLACDADLYIMDEPIKGLDEENRLQTLQTIRKYTEGKLLLMVTHNPEDGIGADLEIAL